MVEIKYGEQYETADLAGKSVREARDQFRAEFGIPDKAKVRLNGKKVKGGLEVETCLCDDDKVSFAASRGRGAFMVGALLLALAATGGVFAFGYITDSTTINVGDINEDFASVTANNTIVAGWDAYGFFKGTTGFANLFNVDTETSQYPGNLTVTVSIGNGDELVNVYRVLAMKIEVLADNGSNVDINGDGNVTGKDDFALLTLRNGAVDLFITQDVPDLYHVNIKSGFYITNVKAGLTPGFEDPLIFCEVTQR